jgi:integrase
MTQVSVKTYGDSMANLGKKNGVYLARFRYLDKEYKRSLKTTDRKTAEGALFRIQDALHQLAINNKRVPQGVDPGDFIFSGGTLEAPVVIVRPAKVPTLQAAIEEYKQNLGHLAENHRYTVAVHLRNLLRKLPAKASGPVDQVQERDLESFIQARLRERSPTTVSKERMTIISFFGWLLKQGHLTASPGVNLTPVKASGDLPPFRTVEQIEEIIGRGGLSRKEEFKLWETLYLTPAEIAEVLGLVRERAKRDVSLVLHAIPAYTGMRRSEVCRLCWNDVEFDQNSIVARSRKQSRLKAETSRRIDLHPELKAILIAWRSQRPRGQHVVCDAEVLEPLTSKESYIRFFQPLRCTRWCLASRKNRFKFAFHTYRHSFASNLAANGVDQRIIDEWMGHQTEAMRKRYRHLHPKNRRSAIETFSLATAGVDHRPSCA